MESGIGGTAVIKKGIDMKVVFGHFQGKIVWVLLLLAVTSTNITACASGGNDITEQILESEQFTEVKKYDWQKYGTDISAVDRHTVIEFSDRNCDWFVTRDVRFINDAPNEMDIRWVSSDKSVVTDEGKVTRWQEDKQVTITADICYKGKKYRKNFILTVKGENALDISTFEDYSREQIDKMNSGDDFYEVDVSDFGYLEDIYGTYSNMNVNSWKAALISLYNIKSAMGIGNPFEELKVTSVDADGTGYIFKFDQIYKGLPVLDNQVTIASDENGRVDYFSSSYFPLFGEIDTIPKITEEEAIKKDRTGGRWEGAGG